MTCLFLKPSRKFLTIHNILAFPNIPGLSRSVEIPRQVSFSKTYRQTDRAYFISLPPFTSCFPFKSYLFKHCYTQSSSSTLSLQCNDHSSFQTLSSFIFSYLLIPVATDVHSVGEYRAPVWDQSKHTDLIDTQLNSTTQLTTVTLQPAAQPWLPVLSSIEPDLANTKRIRKMRSERCKQCTLAIVRRSQIFLPHHRPPSRGCRMAKI